jgi:hypothetical protein
MTRPRDRRSARRGTVAVLTAILMVFLLGMVAFAVDIGYIAVAKSEAQSAADSAALAGMDKLAERLNSAPLVAGVPLQTADDLRLAREEAKAFARRNQVGGRAVELLDADIEIGYLANPANRTAPLDQTGWPARPYNAVRVTVRRDASHADGPLELFFAPALGIRTADVQASAIAAFMMGTITPRGNTDTQRGGLLPFAYQVDEWNALLTATGPGSVRAANGRTITVTDSYAVAPQSTGPAGVTHGPDQRLETRIFPGSTASGNYGTITFSKTQLGTGTNVLRDLIRNGPAESDWPDLADILKASPSNPVEVTGEPGLRAAMEDALLAIVGQPRILALYSTVGGRGNNTFYRIVGFAPITVVAADLNGGNKHITIQPRSISNNTLIDGTHSLSFDLTPAANPHPLFLGPRGLVR